MSIQIIKDKVQSIQEIEFKIKEARINERHISKSIHLQIQSRINKNDIEEGYESNQYLESNIDNVTFSANSLKQNLLKAISKRIIDLERKKIDLENSLKEMLR